MTPFTRTSNSPEFDYIDWLRSQNTPKQGVIVGIGDDAAVLAPMSRPWVVTTDTLTEGTDFILTETSAAQIGAKAMAANLSDLAAMAAVPRVALVSLVLPQTASPEFAHELHHGLSRVAAEFGVAIVGGDTNSWPGGLVVGVTVIGECTLHGPVLRSGAKPGDGLFVTGPLGGSIRGRHLSPVPRVREALLLRDFVELRAMADISDGLSSDLGHILKASGCGAELDAEAIPIHADAIALAATTGRTPLSHALNDGEDFELVFAVSPADGERLVRASPVPVWRVGICVEAGFWLVKSDQREPLVPGGWAHQFG